MTHILRSPIFLAMLVALVIPGESAAPPPVAHVSLPELPPAVFAEGEELVYEVAWTVFKIGTIRITSFGNHRAQASIDSYEDLPFVDLHSVYYTVMDSALFSLGSWSLDKSEGLWYGLNYVPDSSGVRVWVDEISTREPSQPPYRKERRDTLTLGSREFVDGLAIGFLPRMLIHTLQRADIPTVLDGKLGTTTYFFEGEKKQEAIDAVAEPVNVIVVHGSTSVVGVFGMTGEFTGWFSDDAAAVPIKGELKVLLGSVTVELIRWKRNGWSPPT